MAPYNVNGDSLRFNFASGRPTIIELDSNYEDESDGTLLGDEEFEERFVRPTPDFEFIRSEPIPNAPDHVQRLDFFSFKGRTYRVGKTIELLNGDFIRITAIVCNNGAANVSLKGIRFRRNKEFDGLLELKLNEVTMVLTFNEDDSRDIYHQSVVSVSLSEVLKIRELIKTNRQFPALSFRSDPHCKNQSKDYITANGILICRFKIVQANKNEGSVEVLSEGECDTGSAKESMSIRSTFRGVTISGGTCSEWSDREKLFDVTERNRLQGLSSLQTTDVPGRRYTFGDGFCGAGGASRGAKAAGLRVEWGFDFDPAAIDSYHQNFYRARCEVIAAHDFITILTEDFRVDILHLSPPCQTFSPYHVHQGKNDELNQATFFAIEELLKKVKPRIVTLEETFGLTRILNHQPWFRAMIQVFTKLGFSVRWKVFNLADFGLPQPRKRLFLFASCPGEPLPEFPPRTHCKPADLHRFPNLLPFTTVNDVISRIPSNSPLHNPQQMPPRSEAPYNGDLPLRHTICCNGSLDCHPSGKRNFTLGELAGLQRFPPEHKFGTRRVRQQIGNAVPPVVAKPFFDHLRRHLLRVDGLA